MHCSPSFIEEKKLLKKGFWRIAGIDEVGRGPLAGPVVACAATFSKRISFSGLRDSKQLTPSQREYWYSILCNHSAIEWGIGKVSERIIDKINIFQATRLAMKKALLHLQKKLSYDIDFILVDGNMHIDCAIPQKSIIKGDELVFSCAAASIIAKVTRDRLMQKYHKLYPQYRFDKHKGYGTSLHIAKLKTLGCCPIHRKTFEPVRSLLALKPVESAKSCKTSHSLV